MNKNYESALYETAISSFEQLCFMFHAPELEDSDHKFQTGAMAMVEFSGPFKGTLYLKVCKDLLTAVASNMLGEEQPTLQNQKDALGEMSNVICGNVLSKITPQNEAFSISSPKVFEEDVLTEDDRKKAVASVNIPLDEGYTELILFMDNQE